MGLFRKTPFDVKPPVGTIPDYDHPLMQGLVAWWPLLEGAGSTAADYSRRNKNGTLTFNGVLSSGPIWASGDPRFGGPAIEFDGSNDLIDCGTDFDLTGDVTVSASIILYTVAASPRTIVGHDSDFVGVDSYRLEVNRTGGRISTVWNSNIIHTGAITLNAFQWYHVVFCRRGVSGSWTSFIYIDGKLDSSATTAVNPDDDPAARTIIGAHLDITPSTYRNFFQGKIADVRLYNRVLSQNEILRLYINPWEVFSSPSRLMLPTAAGGQQPPRSIHQYRQRRVMV